MLTDEELAKAKNVLKITQEALDEWRRGAALWPQTDSFPDGTGGGGRKTWEEIAKISCDRAFREGRCTWAHVLDEETAEALAETDPAKLRAELIQVAAVAMHWVANLDARGQMTNKERNAREALNAGPHDGVAYQEDDGTWWEVVRGRPGRRPCVAP